MRGGEAKFPSMPIRYGFPMLFMGVILFIFEVYMLKFSTDALLLSPAAMGTIMSISRLWDAASDPLVGFLSDATRAPFGRRRSWMLGSALPIWGAILAVFSPPQLDKDYLALWMLPAVIAYYTATTAFTVPHLGFGSELTQEVGYHQRSVVFGWRNGLSGLGNILGVGALFAMMAQEPAGPQAVRAAAASVALVAGGLVAAAIAAMVFSISENVDCHANAPRTDIYINPVRIVLTVCRHALVRQMTLLWGLAEGSRAVFGTIAPYALQYTLGLPAPLVPLIILMYVLANTATLPLWLAASKRYGKVDTWRAALLCNALCFVPLMFALHPGFIALPLNMVRLPFAVGFASFVGGCAGATTTLANSLMGDVIDADAASGGEAHHGLFFAWWAFVSKSVGGAITVLTGVTLEVAGFVPNVEQSLASRTTIGLLLTVLPLVGLSTAAACMNGFELSEAYTREVQAALAAKLAGELL
mmetsp:Transcript_32350/g.53539  ORF Transcript_32350/g.53539 Transcript_32350/m.53539 type:complete len:472 (+) Transcript_32350:159-1574(+)|eukprot:CAMPEP_0119338932 /NCGR_PEP_ID=MMETSP1333-20130426/97224_1 /TAXON_ID=418940 /ORGANISM="Scyphosphaera apsteinii, Strain RCC1455" /LENGTH=471 /DNA_ID=CAMNT_0007350353 /DNA_START=158 /DNA_END=1573 /DNA_ORIENTATION=-